MDIIYSAVSIWVIVVWIVGAITITGLLAILAMWTYSKLFGAWARSIKDDLRLNLWVYQAMHAWERDGNPRPDAQTMTEEQKLK